MLSSVRFTNFKSWPAVHLPCGKITGVFGTNSSGKTSLIQFLLLLKQTKAATDRAISLELDGDLVKLGTIADAIHRHDIKRSVDWSLNFQLKDELTLSDPSRKKASLVVAFG
jgi:AAA15 family ATPase/GTPase